MSITKEQLNKMIKEELTSALKEADEVDLNKEVMIDGYGSLTLGQIQKRMAKMLADAAEEAQQEPPSFRTLNNGVLIAMYKTLRDHNATNDIFLKEEISNVLEKNLGAPLRTPVGQPQRLHPDDFQSHLHTGYSDRGAETEVPLAIGRIMIRKIGSMAKIFNKIADTELSQLTKEDFEALDKAYDKIKERYGKPARNDGLGSFSHARHYGPNVGPEATRQAKEIQNRLRSFRKKAE